MDVCGRLNKNQKKRISQVWYRRLVIPAFGRAGLLPGSFEFGAILGYIVILMPAWHTQ